MTAPIRNFRRLIVFLIVSGALNIALISFMCYWMIRERPPTPFEHRPASAQEQQSPLAIDHSNSEVIRYFRKMPFEWLLTRLDNTKLVENGYSQRDLALACLVAFHSFDLSRALPSLPAKEQTRTLIYGNFRDGTPAELTIYPGLTDQQYELIKNFAATEKWPLTVKGLFFALRKQPQEGPEGSLVDAFTMSPEFLTVELLFSRGEVSVEKSELVNVILQGKWDVFTSFVEQQKISQDLSQARRQRFLLDYIEQQSKAAAYLMLKTDGDFAANKLDDKYVTMLLQLLDEKSPDSEKFALAQLASPRSDQVWKLAATRLYEYAGESIPEKYQHNAALTRFLPGHPLLQKSEPAPAVATSAPPIIPPKATPKQAPAKKAIANAIPPIKAKANVDKPKTPATSDKKNTTIAKGPAPAKSKPAPSKPIAVKKESKPVAVTTIPKSERIHVVAEGETLWKIANRYNVDVAILRAYNKLESDTLRAGKILKIPSKKPIAN